MKLTNTHLQFKANSVTDFSNHRALKKMSDDLMSLMLRKKGRGLAANQCGILIPLFVMNVNVPIRAFNPTAQIMGDMVMGKEGCLSFPNKFLILPAPSAIIARWQNWKGEEQQKYMEGLEARVFCHECDHLNGKTMYDRIKHEKV